MRLSSIPIIAVLLVLGTSGFVQGREQASLDLSAANSVCLSWIAWKRSLPSQ